MGFIDDNEWQQQRIAGLLFSRDRSWQELIDEQYFDGATSELLALLQQNPRARILEIGYGEGKVLTGLRQSYGDLRLHGIDLTLAYASRDKDINWNEADAHQLPFYDNTFDIIISVATLHYAIDKIEAFREAHRVLVPGGIALLHVHDYLFDPLGQELYPDNNAITWFSQRGVRIEKKNSDFPDTWSYHGFRTAEKIKGGFNQYAVQSVYLNKNSMFLRDRKLL